MRQAEEKFIVRMPPGLRDRIKAKARENRRSMNAEIILHLERIYGIDNQENEKVATPAS